jgi:hypothetical protein
LAATRTPWDLLVSDPHGTVLEVVDGVLVADRVGVDATVLQRRRVFTGDRRPATGVST